MRYQFFSLFGPWRLTPAPKFTKRGNDLADAEVYHPAKFQPDRANHLRDMRYQFFSLFGPWRLTPGSNVTKWGDNLLYTQIYHSTKLQPDLANGVRDIRYQSFQFWRWFLTPQGHPGSNLTMAIDSLWVLRISGSWGPTSYLSPFARHFESKFWLWPFDLERANP